MDAQTLLTERRVTAILMILCFAVFMVGGILFTSRAIWKWPATQTDLHLRWERGIVLVAMLINVLGFVLLDGMLRKAGAAILSPLALVLYLIATVVLAVAEMAFLNNREWGYPQIVFYVVVTFVAQAAFGAALLQSGIAPPWVGWLTIGWNLAWMVGLLIVTPGNIYYPALHHFAPLVFGIVLLVRQP